MDKKHVQHAVLFIVVVHSCLYPLARAVIMLNVYAGNKYFTIEATIGRCKYVCKESILLRAATWISYARGHFGLLHLAPMEPISFLQGRMFGTHREGESNFMGRGSSDLPISYVSYLILGCYHI